MATYEYAVSVRRELLDELRTAGVADAGLVFDATTAWVTTDADRARVDPVVAAHDAGAIDAAAAREEAQDADRRQRLRQVVAALEAGTLTLAQTEAALARLLRVLARRGVL